MRLLPTIIVLIFALGIFFGLTNSVINGTGTPWLAKALMMKENTAEPEHYKGIKELWAERSELNRGLENASELAKRRDDLLGKLNAIPVDQRDRLNNFLPDNVDNVQLIIDINNIASNQGMIIKNIKLQTGDENKSANRISVAAASSSNPINTIKLAFSVSGPYESFLNFMDSLAQSLRLVDVSMISFSSDEKNFYTYNVEIKTYWLK